RLTSVSRLPPARDRRCRDCPGNRSGTGPAPPGDKVKEEAKPQAERRRLFTACGFASSFTLSPCHPEQSGTRSNTRDWRRLPHLHLVAAGAGQSLTIGTEADAFACSPEGKDF